MDSSLLWPARAFIYEHFARTARAPAAADLARHFDIKLPEAESLLLGLHERHALFLEPGTTNILIADPFSAVPTPYEVSVAGRVYWSPCAWDTFGLLAALHAADGEIRANCAATGAPLRLRVVAGQAQGAGEVVHFLLPFQRWYDNLAFT